ncbi:2-oxoacid:acceptor oxidoreductase subunit alpha [Propionivibrio limicola]|uniref:2-oxoacid:acceptor oxidoreductase subunit alpha n=1 Tax=Propionivibrio limicola TaxID=167645 RepID=UPI0012923E3D|nr:2-oxoacid:acceptor oxidoreductase subunit alpha [Propionivibrio limicola]
MNTMGKLSAAAVVGQQTDEPDSIVIRFVGDSGDGMQLTGSEFSKIMGRAGFDFATHPDYPPEISAPAGTLYGVSGFQIKLAAEGALTSGDKPDMLVVMNPAALKTNLPDAKVGATLIINSGTFTQSNLDKAGYAGNPLEDGSLDGYRAFPVDMTGLTAASLADSGLSKKEVGRCKNYFALGIMLSLFDQEPEVEIEDIKRKFAKKDPKIAEANITALRAGFGYAEATELFVPPSQSLRPQSAPGKYRSLSGNQATALGFVTASEKSGVPLFLGSYPITPATDILHELAALKHFNITTFQAEDEIGGICSAIGAAYGGVLGLTTTSGPGMALKTEAMGLAVMLELPLVIVNVQRGGPSTGLPTKVEQSDLLQAVYGRNGECPVPVIAARSPADCFECAFEAFRLATKYMTPVILLTDGGIANAAEPWRIPDVSSLPEMKVTFRTDPEGFMPYARDENLARPWVRPGTPGLEHRVGGLEKDFSSGNISQVPANHQHMVETRAAKVAGIAKDIPPTQIDGPSEGDLLIVSWGGTFGSVTKARDAAEKFGKSVAHVHLRHLNPLPPDLGDILKRYKTVLVPELNLGQLSRLLRDAYLCDVVSLSKVQGKPFMVAEILHRILELA